MEYTLSRKGFENLKNFCFKYFNTITAYIKTMGVIYNIKKKNTRRKKGIDLRAK